MSWIKRMVGFGLPNLGRPGRNRGPFKPVGLLAQVRAVSVLILPF